MIDVEQANLGIYVFAWICVEIDLSKDILDRMVLKHDKFEWIQVLDYEK
jgi:hypothetical protein